jgi:hypothetical protein
MTEQQEKIFAKWLETRPQVIRELAIKFPPGEYRMKDGAPYGISCEGTKVHLESYLENGSIGVVVLAENKLPAGLEHERILAERYEKNVKEIHAQNVKVEVDPKWLEKI